MRALLESVESGKYIAETEGLAGKGKLSREVRTQESEAGRRVSGELLEEAQVIAVEQADVVDAVLEHGATRRPHNLDTGA